ncbi:TRAP-type C4-dicarboxylate transport system, periplasmic component [Olavius algarvensis Delta 1 endosymbiont]|nr:TRAP-type C4-dicarboxylate transport system, periplasmic component [Olavius algarvensis Delta 1 endosymbiont]
MKRKKLFIAILSLTLFLPVILVIQAQAADLKFGHVGAPGSLFTISVEEFAKRVNAEVEGYKVVAFGSSQLGKDRELLRKLKLGTVDFCLPSTVMSSVVDEFGLFEMPYLVKNRLHMRAIRDQLFWSKLAPAVEKQGYQIIAVWENGFRNITNNAKPIKYPEDLKGIKLRTPKGAWRVKMFKSYGANPTPMALSEVFVALQTGVIDGQENPMAQIYSQKFQEVQKYLSLTGHVYTPAYVTVSKKHWAKLPPEVRGKIASIAQGMQEFVYMKAAQLDDELLEKMESAVSINKADKNAFIGASSAIYEEFGQKVPGGAELVKTAQALGEMY